MLSNTEPSQYLTQSPDSAGLQSVIPAFCTDAAAACAALKKQVVATEPRATETQQEHISVMSGSDQTQNSSPKDARRGVPLLHKDDLSYEQFVGQFMQPNLPVMIQASTCAETSTIASTPNDQQRGSCRNSCRLVVQPSLLLKLHKTKVMLHTTQDRYLSDCPGDCQVLICRAWLASGDQAWIGSQQTVMSTLTFLQSITDRHR